MPRTVSDGKDLLDDLSEARRHACARLVSRIDGSDQHARPCIAVHAVSIIGLPQHMASRCVHTGRPPPARESVQPRSHPHIYRLTIYHDRAAASAATRQSCAIDSGGPRSVCPHPLISVAASRFRAASPLCEYRTGRAGTSLCSAVRGLPRASRVALCMCVPRQPSSLSICAMRRSERDRARLDPASRVAVSTQPAH